MWVRCTPLLCLLLLSWSSRDHSVWPGPEVLPPSPPEVRHEAPQGSGGPAPTRSPLLLPEEAKPGPVVEWVWARVTACSPQDPWDLSYYARHGYEGAVYNIAADLSVFPRGTKIMVPGYLDQSYPGKFWTVDSSGGSVIRRSTREGIVHIDVKFTTLYSVRRWGSRWMHIAVLR